MGRTIGEDGDERCKVEGIGGKVNGPVGGNWPVCIGQLVGSTVARWRSSLYLHAVGTIPPVKITGYGNTAPATLPSTRKRTSRNGPWPNVKPLGRSPRNWFGALKYYPCSFSSRVVCRCMLGIPRIPRSRCPRLVFRRRLPPHCEEVSHSTRNANA